MSFESLPITGDLDDLTPQQRDFVIALIESDGHKGAEADAALAAGYGNGVRDSAKRAARDLLKNPRVMATLKAELKKRFDAAAVLGFRTLVELATSARSESVRLSAANSLIDRSMLGPVVSKNATITAHTSVDDLILELDSAETARQRPPSPNTRRNEVPRTLDADFSVVADET